jgi:DNA invertase Pin-like site-specific DNA recombinase
MEAVIYCRVSSKEQVEGTSLDSQELACKEYATRHQLDVAKVFVERGESAKFADRTQLLEMLEYCGDRKNRIEQLLVWKVDRLARNVGDHFNIKASLLKLGVHVVSVTEPIDAKPEGRLLETILAGFAQFDNDIRATRTLQGMRRRIEEGIFPWKPPLGYRKGERTGTKKTVPDQPDYPTFTILQQAWIDFATGKYTKAQILRLIKARGLRTHAGRFLSFQSLDNIFTDVFYAGIIRDPWTGEEYTGRHIPMISRETFDAVQRVTQRRSRSVPHIAIRTEFPLRSFVRCKNCELALTGSFSRGRSKLYPYYHCVQKHCDLRGYYSLSEVHGEFVNFLASASADEHSLAHLKEWVMRAFEPRASLADALKQRRASDAKKIDDQRQQLIRMKMENLITDDEYRAQRRLLDERVTNMPVDTPIRDRDPARVLGDLDAIRIPLRRLADVWQRPNIEFQRRFQQILLPVGYIYGSIGTAPKAHVLSFFGSSLPANSHEVALEGESWNQLMKEIAELADLLRNSSSAVA